MKRLAATVMLNADPVAPYTVLSLSMVLLDARIVIAVLDNALGVISPTTARLSKLMMFDSVAPTATVAG
jgi:hypothetical protein